MQFTIDAHEGLASDAITVTFRIWKRPQAKVGSRHKVADIVLAIDRVDQVRMGDITDADARRAGTKSRADVLRLLARKADHVDDDTLVYRIQFHRVGSFSEIVGAGQADLTDDEVAEIAARLDRLDRSGTHGPWTRATLHAIAERPGVVSTELAAALGRDRPSFKLDVRKLKALGLTFSLEIGYRLTPKGEAVLAALGW